MRSPMEECCLALCRPCFRIFTFICLPTELKLALIDIYNRVLDEREARKQFVLDYGLLVCVRAR